MTNLEIILLAVIWVGYGVLVNIQNDWYDETDAQGFAVAFTIACSPVILLIRICKGIFTKI